MHLYFFVYFGSLLVDCIPVFAPPAWMWMLFLMLKFDLNPWLVALVGTAGTVSGRLIFSTYIVPWVGEKTLSPDKREDLIFLGKKLSHRGAAAFFFVFLYSILPLSTTALFTATGLAKVKKLIIIPPFFLGNLIGDTILLLSGKFTALSIGDVLGGSFSFKSVALSLFGLVAIAGFLVVDWRQLIIHKKFSIKWAVWK